MSITIGKLAKKHGLSRSTLLYYDTIGLLTPSAHVKGEYRQYSVEDEQRSGQVCKYRQAGISLKDIKRILDSPETNSSEILEQCFDNLNDQIRNLYEQQRIIAGLLKNS